MALSSRVLPASPAPAAATAIPVTLTEGDVIEARVTAVLADGRLRLATALGLADVATKVPLDVGAQVKLLVQTVGQQLTLQLIQILPGSPGDAPEGQALPQAAVAAQKALANALQPAIGGQASPAGLIANLRPLLQGAAGSLPPALQQAAADVLAHALDGNGTVDAERIRTLVQGSGVFREARIAAGDTGAATPGGDLKSALLALRTALAAVVGAEPEPEPAAAPPVRDGSAIADALARLPAAAREAALTALQTSIDPQAAGMAEVLAKAGLDAEPGEPGRAAAPELPRPTASPLPRIDLPPRSEQPSLPTVQLGAERGETVRLVLDQTDAALDRMRLSQYGALHRDDPTLSPVATRDQPAWIFDIPILQGREASNAQVRITRDGGRSADGPTARRFSVEFALDTSSTGPVHAQIRLYGRHVGVTLWAERPDTARLLKDQATILHDALGQDGLDVEEVSVLAGAPGAPLAERGYFVDTRS